MANRSEQTVQTQIRLLLEQSDQGLHCLPFRSCRVWVYTVCTDLSARKVRIVAVNVDVVGVYCNLDSSDCLQELAWLITWSGSTLFAQTCLSKNLIVSVDFVGVYCNLDSSNSLQEWVSSSPHQLNLHRQRHRSSGTNNQTRGIVCCSFTRKLTQVKSCPSICFYTLPHKKWRGIMLYPPKILKFWVSVHPSVRAHRVHRG